MLAYVFHQLLMVMTRVFKEKFSKIPSGRSAVLAMGCRKHLHTHVRLALHTPLTQCSRGANMG